MFETNQISITTPCIGMMDISPPSPLYLQQTLLPCTTILPTTAHGPTTPPRSSRNTEKRRERSKVAARCRRGKESEIFTELSQCLPVSDSSRNNLDKASVMRLTLCDLKLREMMESIDRFQVLAAGSVKNENDETFDSLINNAVSGFVLVCSTDGDVIYVSEGIATCLGLSQHEVMGQSLFEYSHPCDHADVKEMLLNNSCNNKTTALSPLLSTASGVESKSALFRMKSANSTRGRNVHHRSSNYKVVSCFGRMFSENTGTNLSTGVSTEEEERGNKKWFVGICEPLLHPADVDIPLNKQTFLSKHSPDMTFEYVDESISEFIGYKADDMVGKSLFDFYHACDGDGVARSFKSLYTKGQTFTDRTRFLAKGGGWMWVLTHATTINNNAGKPTSVVCIHFVTSGIECEDEVVSHVQLRDENELVTSTRKPVVVASEATTTKTSQVPTKEQTAVLEKKPLQETTNLITKCVTNDFVSAIPLLSSSEEVTAEPLIVNPITGPILSKPTPSTSKIFAPRTDDMDTGFLMPVNDVLIVTKDEPEDLTHLAPIAGDECVTLSNVPLLDDLLQWLDAADMEYTVLEGYEDSFPLPLISHTTCASSMMDSPIPIPMTMTSSEMCPIVKDDVVLESLSASSDHNCDSPLLMRNTDPTLLSSTDPMLLSPFKTPSPEPISPPSTSSSPSRIDFMSSDIFSTFYSDHHGGHIGGRGGTTAGSSSHKSKAGGGYDDDSFSGFPMVSDFQETLFSPCECFDDIGGPPSSPPHLVNLIDTGGLGTLKLDGDGGGSAPSPSSSFETFNKQTDINVGKLQYMAARNPDPGDVISRPQPPGMQERPMPSKVAKKNYADEPDTKPWLQVASVTPTQPPWKVLLGETTKTSPAFQQQQQSFTKRSNSTTIGTQTNMSTEDNKPKSQPDQLVKQRHRQLQRYKQLLMNPVVLQALLLSGRLMTPATANSATSRKRNFVGKLLSNGGLLSNQFGMRSPAGSGGGTANLPGAGFLEMPSALVELTNQDCEVNAPMNPTVPLLDGPDLLTALDSELMMVSGTDCM